jgi:hypothetical protein
VFAFSYIATLKPACNRAIAVASPPIPAPAMIARRDKCHATSRNSHSAGEQRPFSPPS